MPIITPISHLSAEPDFFKKILKFGPLEVRDHSKFEGYEHSVIMYHSEFELTQKWFDTQKRTLYNFISKFPNLKGLSFHMVTRYPSYKLVEGIAQGIGEALCEDTLLKNAEENVWWLKEKFPKMIFMVENNNDLGNDSYQGKLYVIATGLDTENNVKTDTITLYSN